MDRGTRSKDALLDAAERLIAEHGFEVPMRDIAKAAGQRNNSAVNYHFRSRQDLVDAVVARRLLPMEVERERMLGELDPGADSSYINIVGAIDVDRTGQMWGGSIPPTVAVSGPSGATVVPATSASADPVVQAATQWLQTQTACGGTAVASRSEVPTPLFSASPVAASRAGASVAPARALRRPARYHVAQAPRERLRARVLGGRARVAGGR